MKSFNLKPIQKARCDMGLRTFISLPFPLKIALFIRGSNKSAFRKITREPYRQGVDR